jgi:hypothetical protein
MTVGSATLTLSGGLSLSYVDLKDSLINTLMWSSFIFDNPSPEGALNVGLGSASLPWG